MSEKQKDPYEQLVADFLPVGKGIVEFYTKSFLECVTKSSLESFSVSDPLQSDFRIMTQEFLSSSFSELLADLPEKFNLVLFHVLLAVISGRSKDVKSFETRLAHLLRTTITKS